MFRYSFHCPCGERIVLPRQSPLGKFAYPVAEANPQTWPLRFVCRECGLLSVHEVQDIDPEEPGRPDLYQEDRSLWHVQIRCDHRQCGTRYTIYTQGSGTATIEDVLYVLQNAKRPITCGQDGHAFESTMVLFCGPVMEKD